MKKILIVEGNTAEENGSFTEAGIKTHTESLKESLDYLNKELEKNGLDEAAMRTSMIYQGAKEIPDQNYTNFEAITINGQGLGISGGDGNGAGNAYVGTITLDMRLGHAYTGMQGVAISPPHPVTGQRRYATTQTGFAGVFSPLTPGKAQRGFPNTDYVSGGAIWYYVPNHNNGLGLEPGLWSVSYTHLTLPTNREV